MKIGPKISPVYSLLTVLFVLVIDLLFYLFFCQYADDVYYNFLEEKARMLAMECFGTDDMVLAKYRYVVQR
ncbi:MAG: hypothetical protein IJV22_04755 [Bacteroidales bacterium]|nr:hypothetical protein [Bacteroidales bacterium]